MDSGSPPTAGIYPELGEFGSLSCDGVPRDSANLSLPPLKISSIRKELRCALARLHMTVCHLARVIGLLMASIQAIFPAPLHYRALQRLQFAHLRESESYADCISLDPEAKDEIGWWIQNMEAWNGRAIFCAAPEITKVSNASTLGLGRALRGSIHWGDSRPSRNRTSKSMCWNFWQGRLPSRVLP